MQRVWLWEDQCWRHHVGLRQLLTHWLHDTDHHIEHVPGCVGSIEPCRCGSMPSNLRLGFWSSHAPGCVHVHAPHRCTSLARSVNNNFVGSSISRTHTGLAPPKPHVLWLASFLTCPPSSLFHAACAAGHGGGTCQECDAGTFSPGGTSSLYQPDCLSCAVGFTTAAGRSTSSSACTGVWIGDVIVHIRAVNLRETW